MGSGIYYKIPGGGAKVSFKFFGGVSKNDASFKRDYDALKAFLLKNDYICKDPSDRQYYKDYEIGFSLTPAAIKATRQLIAEQCPSLTSQDEDFYENIPFRIELTDKGKTQILVNTPAMNIMLAEWHGLTSATNDAERIAAIVKSDIGFKIRFPAAIDALKKIAKEDPDSEDHQKKLEKAINDLTTLYAEVVADNLKQINNPQKSR